MSENPYQPPQTEPQVTGIKSGRREDLKKIATYQKIILICILIYLIALFSQFLLPEELRILPALGVIAAALVGMVCTFLLAIQVYHPLVGVLYAVLTLVPCLGLLMLLVINGKATTILKDNGHKVGLLGANLSEF